MNLYIMTRGRPNRQETIRWIPAAWKPRTYFVCPMEEKAELKKYGVGTLAFEPRGEKNYSTKFQWILDDGMLDGNDKAVIIDDDLIFSRRVGDRLVTERDPDMLEDMWDSLEYLLDTYPLVGIHGRQMGHTQRTPYVECSKVICVQGVNRKMLGHVKVDYFPILADVFLNCHVLSHGMQNAVITEWCQDHGPSQAPGGCTLYRTAEMQRAAVELVARMYGPEAKVVVKRPKAAKWLGDERYDLRVQWKRLYAKGASLLDSRARINSLLEGD